MGSKIKDGKVALRKVISGWYYALRNLAIVALLSILVYIAIRMILSSVSSDKAKYKIMFKDWLVALCLVFAMHYIMVGTLNITSLITDAIGRTGKNSTMVANVREKVETNLEEASDLTAKWGTDEDDDKMVEALVGDAFGYIAIYAAIAVFTIVFAVKYIIRALTITFLILIAPITCITYPIDKLGDGKSQAFDFWLKEFFMEVIIQPFHLLLYVVLIGASVKLSEANVIYSILCFAIMIPAEKFIKQMFGINEKLGSPLGAFASGALASKLANQTKSLASKGSSGSKGSSSDGGNDDAENNLPPRERGSLGDYDDGRNSTDTSRNNNNGQNNQQRLNSSQEKNSDEEASSNTNNSKVKDEEDYTEDEQALLEAMEDRNNPKIKNEEDWSGDEYALARAMEDYRNSNNDEENIDENEPNNIDNNENEALDNGETDNNTPEPTNNNMPEEDSVPIQRQPRPVREISKARKFARGVRAEAARSVRNKVGSTKGTKVAKYVAGKALKGGLRAALGGIGAGVAGITTLAATGSLSKAAAATAAGAAVGNNVGKGISGAVSKVGKTAGRYYQAGSSAVRSEDATRKKAKSKYMQNQKERDYVRQQLQQASGGQIPSKKEIDKELEKQWEYKEAGIKDHNIIDGGRRVAKEKEAQFLDNTYTKEQKENYNDVEQKLQENAKGNEEGIRYQKAYDQLKNNEITNDYFNAEFGEGEAEKAREHQSMESAVARQRSKYEKQALFAASIANDTSRADFTDRKKMENLQQSYINDYMQECRALNKPMTRERAERVVNEAINDAARIKGIPSGANLPVRERPPVREQQQTTQQTQPTSQPRPQQPTPQPAPQPTPTDSNTDRRTERRNSNRNNPPRSQRVAERRASSQRRNNEHTNDQNVEQGTENNNQRRVGRVTDSQGRSSEVRRGRRSNSSSTGSNHGDTTQPNPHTGPGSTPTPSNHT